MKGGSTMNYSVINSGLKGNDARILGFHSYTRSVVEMVTPQHRDKPSLY